MLSLNAIYIKQIRKFIAKYVNKIVYLRQSKQRCARFFSPQKPASLRG